MAARGSASFKKKDGTMVLSQDGLDVLWTPITPPGAPPSLSIPVSSITNLQATPATSAKAMIKVFAMPSPSTPVEQYVFTFIHPTDSRTEADSFKEALTNAIQVYKTKQISNSDALGQPASLAMASAIVSAGQPRETWTKIQLENDMDLQQSLLSSSTDLQKTFHEAVITGNVTASQFWSTRTHLLRAHATEQAQTRGSYNVLASIKPKTEDNVVKVNLTRDQIHDIFNQHPVVKRVYDENVPKLSEDLFWSRFFLSRLFKKLKGERIVPTDSYDELLDPYLKLDDEANERKMGPPGSVPLIIDLEGNDANHSQRQGNRPDLTMRPNTVENVPIMRTLNSLSTKIMDMVAPADGDANQTDRDERSMGGLRLNDLEGDEEEERIILNITDQTRFFDDKRNGSSLTSNKTRKDPEILINYVRSEVEPAKLNLSSATSTSVNHAQNGESQNDAMDVDDDGNTGITSTHLSKATEQILSSIQIRRSQLEDDTTASTSGDNVTTYNGLSEMIYDRLKLTHATTTEFLHHFWNAFLSGDEKRVTEITNMVESLRRSLERITAVADAAEEEKTKEKDRIRMEQEAREREGKKRRKRRLEDEVGGGSEVVMQVIGPAKRAIEVALERYEQALKEQVDV